MGSFTSSIFSEAGEAIPLKVYIPQPVEAESITRASGTISEVVRINGELWERFDDVSLAVHHTTVWRKCSTFRM